MFIIVGREIPLKNTTPSKNNPAPSFLDPTQQDPFSVFQSIVNNNNPAYGYNPMVHNHQMNSIIKNANTDRVIPGPVEPKDSWKNTVSGGSKQGGYTEQHNTTCG